MLQDIANHEFRTDFKNLFASNCTMEEFDLVGIEMLMSDEVFETYLSNLKLGLTDAEMNESFRREINNALIVAKYTKDNQTKTQLKETTMSINTHTAIPVTEMNVTMDDNLNPPNEPQDARDVELLALRAELIRRDGEELKAKLLMEAKEKAAALKQAEEEKLKKEEADKQKKQEAKVEPVPKAKSKVLKTIAIATVSIAAGAGCAYLYNRFVK